MKTIGEKYLHINNGGVTFTVTDEGFGPTLNISATHFGHLTNGMKLHVSREVLLDLADLLLEAARHEGYSQDYCCALEAPSQKTGGCCGGSCSEKQAPASDVTLKEALAGFEQFRMEHPLLPMDDPKVVADLSKGVSAVTGEVVK